MLLEIHKIPFGPADRCTALAQEKLNNVAGEEPDISADLQLTPLERQNDVDANETGTDSVLLVENANDTTQLFSISLDSTVNVADTVVERNLAENIEPAAESKRESCPQNVPQINQNEPAFREIRIPVEREKVLMNLSETIAKEANPNRIVGEGNDSNIVQQRRTQRPKLIAKTIVLKQEGI